MFQRLRRFVAETSEFGKFKRLIAELSKPMSLEDWAADNVRTIENIFAKPGQERRTRSAALEEYTALLAQRLGVAAVLAHYGYDTVRGKAKLQQLYDNLIDGEGSFWIGKMFAPVLALCDLTLLMELLQADKEKADPLMLAMITNDYYRKTDFVNRLKAARAKGVSINGFMVLRAHILIEDKLASVAST